jgi:hypothetical protein
MKKATLFLTTTMVLTIALALGGAVLAQQGGNSDEPSAEAGRDMPCQMMMERMDKMKEKRQEMKAALDAQLKAMNEASGDAKVEAMATVINTLAEQRQQGWEMRDKMRQNMMQHMSECPMMKEGKCPMTNGMSGDGGGMMEHGGSRAKADDGAHEGHH